MTFLDAFALTPPVFVAVLSERDCYLCRLKSKRKACGTG